MQGILVEILEWSKERPAWQRDALRRLFTKGTLAPEDLDELVSLCKAAHGLAEPRASVPVAEEHLAIKGNGAEAVSLVNVTHHRGVNALAPEQTVAFGPNLTIVYGPNAAGKSGYTRILKRACRARSTEDILGNVLSGETPLKAQATIRYRRGAAETSVAWMPAAAPPAALAAVSVFDSHCAPVYLRDKTDVAFRPFSLDVFDKLAAACAEARSRLESERAKLEAETAVLPSLSDGTKARKLLDNLTALTRIDEVRALAMLSKDEERRLTELRNQKRDLDAADPKRRADELDLKATRLDGLAGHVAKVADALGDAGLKLLRGAADSLRAARKSLEILRKTTLAPDLLLGTGTDEWRALWRAAAGFSVVAHPELVFPVTSEGARCPLCQQPIGPEAAERLKHFQEYVSSTAQTEVQRAEGAYTESLRAITAIAIESPQLEAWLAELSGDDGLSITHIFRHCVAQFNISESRQSSPHDHVAGWGIAGPGQIAAEPGQLGDV